MSVDSEVFFNTYLVLLYLMDRCTANAGTDHLRKLYGEIGDSI